MSEIDNIITMTDENGNPVDFEFLDAVDYQGKEYIVLMPAEEGADEVVILEVEEGPDEDTACYCSVEDDDVLDAVFAIFRERNKDVFNFT